jgi:GNAT superfamily N-acetyltransferase
MTRGPEPVGALADLLSRVAAGQYPPPDGGITILPQPSPRDCGVISFTAHSVIFTDADPGWVRAQLPDGDLGAPLGSRFLQALYAQTGRTAAGDGRAAGPARSSHTVDTLWLTESLPGSPGLRLARSANASHPRVALARRYRDNVMVWAADGGIVLLGRGVAGRWEVGVEVEPDRRGQGLGRELAAAARHLIPAGAPLWAQIAPGNAASVRAFLAAGYRPVGAEALLNRLPP